MKFTKAMTTAINTAFSGIHELTENEIEQGKVTVTYSVFGVDRIKTVSRDSSGWLNVTCRFTWDTYNFQNGWFDKPNAAFIQAVKY